MAGSPALCDRCMPSSALARSRLISGRSNRWVTTRTGRTLVTSSSQREVSQAQGHAGSTWRETVVVGVLMGRRYSAGSPALAGFPLPFPRMEQCRLETADGRVVASHVEVATGMWRRFMGLMFRSDL